MKCGNICTVLLKNKLVDASLQMFLLMQHCLYGITETVVQRCSVKALYLKFLEIHRKIPALSCLFNKVEGLRLAPLNKTLAHVFFREFCKIFRTPILYNICDRLLLVLMRIGVSTSSPELFQKDLVFVFVVWRAANLFVFCIIVSKSVFEVLRYSF